MFTNRHSWSVGMYPIAACPILAPASKIVNPSNTPYGAWCLRPTRVFHTWPPGFTCSTNCATFTSFHHMYSCPLLNSHVDLSAIEQVWQAIHRLMLNTNVNCHFGCRSS